MLFFLIFFNILIKIHCIPASPFPTEYVLPDGSSVDLYLRGGPFHHWRETDAGLPVVLENGQLFLGERYVFDGDGIMVKSSNQQIMSQSDLKKFDHTKRRRSLNHDLKKIDHTKRRRRRLNSLKKQSMYNKNQQLPSVLKNLVLLLRFSDHKNDDHLPTRLDYDILFNKIGGDSKLAPTGSIRDVFDFNLYGKLALESTVVGWVDVNITEKQASGTGECFGTCSQARLHEAIIQALEKLSETMDFSQFDLDNDGFIDGLTVIHSGFGAEWGAPETQRIWSHKWTFPRVWAPKNGRKFFHYNINPGRWGDGLKINVKGDEITRIGVVSHEISHFLGLPDLYDLDSDGSGIGQFGLMGYSWGWDNTQRYPASLSAWSKYKLGVVKPIEINTTGTYPLGAIQTTGDVYLIRRGYGEGEYLLIENRQPIGFDKLHNPGGILVWHIDENKQDNTQNSFPGAHGWPNQHYRVRLIQADGQFHLEKGSNTGDPDDWWVNGNILGDLTNPNLQSYVKKCTGNFIYNFQPNRFSYFAANECTGDQTNDLVEHGNTCVDHSPTGIKLSENNFGVRCEEFTTPYCQRYFIVRDRCGKTCQGLLNSQQNMCSNSSCTDMDPSQVLIFEKSEKPVESCQQIAHLCETHTVVKNVCPNTCQTCDKLRDASEPNNYRLSMISSSYWNVVPEDESSTQRKGSTWESLFSKYKALFLGIAGLGLLVVIVLVVCCFRRRRNKNLLFDTYDGNNNKAKKTNYSNNNTLHIPTATPAPAAPTASDFNFVFAA